MLSSKQFSYNRDGKALIAEISDFGPDFRFEQIYNDSCDEGLQMVSEKSGRVAKFAVNGVDKDHEGDLTAWNLIPTRETLRAIPELRGVSMKIFND